MSRVAIVSCAIDGFQDSIDSRGTEWTFKTARRAMDKAGVTRDDLDGVMGSDMDAYCGLTVSFGLKVCAAGGYKKQSTRIQNGGVYTLEQARMKVLSGKADYVMIFSEDNVNFDAVSVSNLAQDAVYTRDLGENYVQSMAMLSNYYLSNSSATEETFADVAARNYAAGSSNPHAHRSEAYTRDEILESEMVSWPLRELETAPISKGSVAVIVASEEAARDHEDPIWMDGAGLGSSRYWYRSFDEQVRMPSLQKAVDEAYEEAGINDPLEDLDVAEVFNPASPLELMAYEVLGLCGRGEAADLLDDGTTALDGDVAVNPSGGSLVVNPLNASGLYRTAQAVMALRGELPHSSLENAKRAVVTDSDMMLGVRGSSDGALVLGKE